MTADATLRFLVWNMSRGFPTCSHATMDAAIAEAERLAKRNPGESFNVMAPVGFAMVEKPAVFRFHLGMARAFGSFERFCAEEAHKHDDGLPF